MHTPHLFYSTVLFIYIYKALLPIWLLCLLSVQTKTIGRILIPGSCIAQPLVTGGWEKLRSAEKGGC